MRIIEFIFCIFLLILFLIPILIIAVLIKLNDGGKILHWSKRIGVDNNIFLMPKFRTMKENSPNLATHLMKNPDLFLTRFGKFLRKFSLDEIPQLFSIIKGDMSFVGPRPALFNQHDLIDKRTVLKIEKIKPGITGWAQINGRDDISIDKKVEYDHFYLKNKSLIFDLKIIVMTFTKILLKKNISH